jgi:excinuclease ABC subunit B
LDADKEGFLRSETSLVQIIGRAARNSQGRVTLYADRLTGSINRALAETNRRRALQIAYNEKHGITPETVKRTIEDITESMESDHQKAVTANLTLDQEIFKSDPQKLLRLKAEEMEEAVRLLDFETAAILRDEIKALEGKLNKKRK